MRIINRKQSKKNKNHTRTNEEVKKYNQTKPGIQQITERAWFSCLYIWLCGWVRVVCQTSLCIQHNSNSKWFRFHQVQSILDHPVVRDARSCNWFSRWSAYHRLHSQEQQWNTPKLLWNSIINDGFSIKASGMEMSTAPLRSELWESLLAIRDFVFLCQYQHFWLAPLRGPQQAHWWLTANISVAVQTNITNQCQLRGEKHQWLTNFKLQLETKASFHEGQCIPAGSSVTLPKMVLITMSIITMRSISRKLCVQLVTLCKIVTAILRILWRHLQTDLGNV